jgi:hypothetical protein
MKKLVRILSFFAMGFVVRPLSISRLFLLMALLGIILYIGENENE